MRSINLARIFTASVLLLTLGNLSSAQELSPILGPKHHRYRFIDLGTFGGPHSIIPFVQHVLTKHGTVIGIAESDIDDPFAPKCASPNCKVQSGFNWHSGVKTRLHGLSADDESGVQAINESGTVVGDSQTGLIDPTNGLPEINAVLWKQGEIVNLGTLGGNSSGALSIANRGQIVGWSETMIPDPSSGGTEIHAFLWKNGVMHDLGTLGGPVSFGQDVNDHGQVVGYSFTDSILNPATGMPTQHPFFWENGHMHDLSLGGTDGGSVFVNSRGQSIGDSTLAGDVERHAFLWSQGKLHDLGTLGGTRSRPTGLTEDGHVSGGSTTTNDETIHAVVWRNRKIYDLGTVPGDACSLAWGLNSKDQVVGISLPFPCDFSVAHAFLWDRGTMLDLNTLIPPDSGLKLVYAEAINDAGEIAGIGVPPGISPADVEVLGHAYVLVPIKGDTVDDQHTVDDVDASGSAKTTIPRAVTTKLMDRLRTQHVRRYRMSGLPLGRGAGDVH